MEKTPIQALRPSVVQCSYNDARKYPHSDVTGKIIGVAIEVHKILGPGFLESVYEEAMACELDRLAVPYERQKLVRVWFRGAVIGQHRMDLIVDRKIVVELKAVKEIDDNHRAVTLSYLRASGLEVGLVINFAKAVIAVRRMYCEAAVGNTEN